MIGGQKIEITCLMNASWLVSYAVIHPTSVNFVWACQRNPPAESVASVQLKRNWTLRTASSALGGIQFAANSALYSSHFSTAFLKQFGRNLDCLAQRVLRGKERSENFPLYESTEQERIQAELPRARPEMVVLWFVLIELIDLRLVRLVGNLEIVDVLGLAHWNPRNLLDQR
jgi:hypothetical protein